MIWSTPQSFAAAVLAITIVGMVVGNPACAAAQRNVGSVQLVRGMGGHAEPLRARGSFERALAADPSDGRSRVRLARLDLAVGKPAAATEWLTPLIQSGTAGADASFAYGDALDALGQRDLAVAAWRQVPNLAAAHVRSGDAQAARGEWAAAVAEYELATRIDPSFAPAFRAVGHAYVHGLGRIDEGLAAYARADELGLGRRDPYLYTEIGHALSISGQHARALEFLKAHGRSDALAQSIRGVGYLSLGDLANARLHLEQARDLTPSDKWTRLQLGHVYRAQGEIERATVEWVAALQLDPQFREAREALAALR